MADCCLAVTSFTGTQSYSEIQRVGFPPARDLS